jgi:hypothetical protein
MATSYAPPESRFWSKVDIRAADDCWPWRGTTTGKTGYGRAWRGPGWAAAHRLAWELTHGSTPDGFVCHKCDNPPCCNPAHLFVGTHTDNMRDMFAKGRNWQSKVTHCPHGHEYTPENTRVRHGRRECLICVRRRTAETPRELRNKYQQAWKANKRAGRASQ